MVENVVVSVGGSLLVPKSGIDTDFLSDFRACIIRQIETTNRQFNLIVGGGKTARDYQEAMRKIANPNSVALDRIGVHATRMNAELVMEAFNFLTLGQDLYPHVLTTPEEIFSVPRHTRIVIAGGFRPGASTDLGAIQLAIQLGARRVVNLSNTKYVYTADPNTNPEAKAIPRMQWSEFRKLIPSEWAPGLSAPFDPIAAKQAEEHDIEVACINGERLKDFVDYLDRKPFTGTRLTPNE